MRYDLVLTMENVRMTFATGCGQALGMV